MTEIAATPATPVTTEKARRRSPAQWFADQDKRELAVWGALLALGLVVRFIALGERAFHHDESQDAYFSYLFRQTGDYEYNPLLHGPLRFYLTALMYVTFGDSDFTARLAPALMGAAMIPLCWGLRSVIGRVAACAAAVFFAFGPSFLYFSRFAREDIYFASLTLALIVVIWRGIDRPRKYHPALIGVLFALLFGTKETMFISLFAMGLFFIVALLLSIFVQSWRAQLIPALVRPGVDGWGYFLAAFAGVFTLLFTTFLTHPSGLYDGVVTGLDYWLGQHEVGRGGEHPTFYWWIIATVEWPILILAGIGAVSLWSRNGMLSAFLVFYFVVNLIVYAVAGEKFAWLVLHQLLPLILLAGVGVQAIWEARGVLRAAGLAFAALAAVYLALSSWWVNHDRGTDPREFLVSTQSSEQVKQVADQVLALAESRGPTQPPLTVTVDSAEGATFPYAWYFRHLQSGYIDYHQENAAPPTSDVLILTDTSKARMEAAGQLAPYDGRQFDFRIWWVREYDKINTPNPTNWFNYVTKREVWNPTGGMKEWLYIKR
ncbi:TIGR03663 family protein [Solirubrobacter sp. CPCC 204708]|uniref:TIGR03663 family protein n=1 Tax=Solirubrobacter deserti TaxID=2282478 RepID=A0ABT4RHF1_9ACTN|nr:flippase activity-associated protein Agl23 [Solirubrobacter deserti]MBE2315282.1 TIGR03663 family protein [Solirubrobacter deserti]MDA0137967.1 TIGR03663 family protein [Solirubrobacter deserti]